MPEKTTDKTYENPITVPKYNISALDEAEIVGQLEYFLFIDHEEDMKGYSHLRPLLKELAQLVIRISDGAVAEFQRDMTRRIAENLQDSIGINIANSVYDAQVKTSTGALVSTVIGDRGIVSQDIEVEDARYDW